MGQSVRAVLLVLSAAVIVAAPHPLGIEQSNPPNDVTDTVIGRQEAGRETTAASATAAAATGTATAVGGSIATGSAQLKEPSAAVALAGVAYVSSGPTTAVDTTSSGAIPPEEYLPTNPEAAAAVKGVAVVSAASILAGGVTAQPVPSAAELQAVAAGATSRSLIRWGLCVLHPQAPYKNIQGSFVWLLLPWLAPKTLKVYCAQLGKMQVHKGAVIVSSMQIDNTPSQRCVTSHPRWALQQLHNAWPVSCLTQYCPCVPRCGVRNPSPAEGRAMQRELMSGLRQRAALGAASVNVPQVGTWFHIVRRGDALEDGNIPDSWVLAQLDVLNKGFANRVNFTLLGVTKTLNPTWFPLSFGSPQDIAMKRALRRGTKATLNVFITDLNDGLLGWATFPAIPRHLEGELVLTQSETVPRPWV